MLTTIATVLAGLIGVGIMAIGTRFLLQPRQSAAAFGIPGSTPPSPWLWVKGVRDITFGLIAFVLIANGAPHLLGAFVLAETFAPVGDMLIVLRSKGPRSVAYGIHGATALVMLVIAALLIFA